MANRAAKWDADEWTETEARRVLAACRASGLSIRAYAFREGRAHSPFVDVNSTPFDAPTRIEEHLIACAEPPRFASPAARVASPAPQR